MYCGKCGKAVPDDSKACPWCGSPQKGSSQGGWFIPPAPFENNSNGTHDVKKPAAEASSASSQPDSALRFSATRMKPKSREKMPENYRFYSFSQGDNSSPAASSSDNRLVIHIGRDPKCDFQVAHPTVAKEQATIKKVGDYWQIADEIGADSISVNGEPLRDTRTLHEDDVIVMGRTRMVFSENGLYYDSNPTGISVRAHNIVRKVKEFGKKPKTICDHVNLQINGGELVAIIGGSGAGKSTLMNSLCGYVKPTSGSVTINGDDLYRNLGVFRNIIGYVPQSDIVFNNLSVEDMLYYAAKLRLPHDTTDAEVQNRINDVIRAVDLQGSEKTKIKKLSGGQKKRVSIAVELLPDPGLLFLDEPTSGLDPGTERALMLTLQEMTKTGKTIILVTHSTLQLAMCNKIVFMGKGGRLCYCGDYSSALKFFSVDNIIDIYQTISSESKSKQRAAQYNEFVGLKLFGEDKKDSSVSIQVRRRDPVRQLVILLMRNLRLLMNDMQRLMLLLLQAPLLAVLIYLVADGNQFELQTTTKSLMFALACSGFWLGTLNAIQEVCKERAILTREYMTGLHLSSYLLAKLTALAIVCAVQALLLVLIFTALAGAPENGMVMEPVFEMLITTFLTEMAATAMGLFVSSLFRNADRAMTVAPLLLMPQILFSGVVFDLSGATECISWFAACRWAMECYGTTVNLNDLPVSFAPNGSAILAEAEELFEHTSEHIFTAWGILAVFIIGFTIAGRIVLQTLKSSRS